MRFMKLLRRTAGSHFHLLTGYGAAPPETAESEAAGAVFLPVTALLAGLLALLPAYLAGQAELMLLTPLAGLAVLAALGGISRLKAVSALLKPSWAAAGTAAVAALALLTEFSALYEVVMYTGAGSCLNALLYAPVAAAVAMLAESSVSIGEGDGEGRPLSGVKGWHLACGCALAFLLMLPAFGVQAFLYTVLSVLAGAVTALTCRRNGFKDAARLAALAAEILFLVAYALLNRQAVIYY